MIDALLAVFPQTFCEQGCPDQPGEQTNLLPGPHESCMYQVRYYKVLKAFFLFAVMGNQAFSNG